MLNETEYLAALRADSRKWTPSTPDVMAIKPPRRWTRARTLAALAMGPSKVAP